MVVADKCVVFLDQISNVLRLEYLNCFETTSPEFLVTVAGATGIAWAPPDAYTELVASPVINKRRGVRASPARGIRKGGRQVFYKSALAAQIRFIQ